MKIQQLNKDSFLRKVADYERPSAEGKVKFLGQRPVVVDFYATWCGPCKMLAPMLEAVAETYEGQVDFFKVDIDENRDTALAYNIRSVPTLMLFHPNGTTEKQIGLPTRMELINMTNKLVYH